jgi:hypothetical protein
VGKTIPVYRYDAKLPCWNYYVPLANLLSRHPRRLANSKALRSAGKVRSRKPVDDGTEERTIAVRIAAVDAIAVRRPIIGNDAQTRASSLNGRWVSPIKPFHKHDKDARLAKRFGNHHLQNHVCSARIDRGL